MAPHSTPTRSLPLPPDAIRAARGGRALEASLLEALEAEASASRRDPRRLRRPVIVVVPSAALRRHLQARIAQALGPSVLGIAVQIVGHAATDVLREAGKAPPTGGPMFDVLARRATRAQPELRSALGALEDGFGVAANSIRDLLSAGFDDSLARPAAEALGKAPRAQALIEAAARTRQTMDDAGFGRQSDTLAAAARALEDGTALPVRAIHIYGFADAPGNTTRFLAALLRQAGARIWVDRPGDPCNGADDDVGVRFLDRFLQRLGFETGGGLTASLDGTEPTAKGGGATTRLLAFSRAGEDREAREVAHRIRDLLDQGIEPESIGVVARRLEPHAAALRKHLGALSIPFSGGSVPARWSPGARRIDALLTLLERGGDAPAETWLQARRPSARRVDLGLALRVLGLSSLTAVARVDLDRWLRGSDALALPVRRGLATKTENREEGEGKSSIPVAGENPPPTSLVINARRKVSRRHLDTAIGEAQAVVDLLAGWPDEAPIAQHTSRARELADALRLISTKDAPTDRLGRILAGRWDEALDGIDTLGPQFTISHSEFLLLLRRALDRPWEPLGGAGGGVAVLDVSRARGLTFDHLFVVGLEREVFPRPISEDPLLTDRHRQRLGAVLPHLATAAISHDEERLLFASLVGSAHVVTLSWRHVDADGREVAASPFLERMIRHGVLDREQIKAARTDTRDGTAREALLTVATENRRDLLPSLLPLAIDEGRERLEVSESSRRELPAPESRDLATAKIAVLDAVDPDRTTPEGRQRLGAVTPWFGLLGQPRPGRDDPRLNTLAVTGLEGIARCPWRAFLSRDLRIEPHPDPLAGPRGFSPLLIGNIAHKTLESLMIEAGVPAEVPLEANDPATLPVTRPNEAAVERALRDAVDTLAREDGLFLPGLHTTLATLTRPLVVAALDTDFNEGPVSVVAVEASATVPIEVNGRTVDISFKADRVDRTPDGLRLTDYKTGKPLSDSAEEATRLRHLAKKVASGTSLQAGAYAAVGPAAEGRYLYLKRDLPPELRGFSITSDDPNVKTFLRTAAALLESRADGVQFPRLGDGKGSAPEECERCEHVAACVHHDSGLKMRLEQLASKAIEGRDVEAKDSPRPFDQHLGRLWDVEKGGAS